MDLGIGPAGRGRCLYDEALDLRPLGALHIRRASHVEPDPSGRWQADLSPVGGPVLGPFAARSDALKAERDWLEDALLQSAGHPLRPV